MNNMNRTDGGTDAARNHTHEALQALSYAQVARTEGNRIDSDTEQFWHGQAIVHALLALRAELAGVREDLIEIAVRGGLPKR